ncbi:MAG TPA: DUF262 domain-containing protein [Planctomycetota bacterium]|nr:DUF262 domain-containing protein [Planctomycetota bacterium]
MTDIAFVPLVKSATTSQSPNVRSIMDEMADGTYLIPDYQRDSSQWDREKKSRFIESLINNLTVPPLIVYPEDDPKSGLEKRHIVDGQQRLTTIREFLADGFALSKAEDVEYAANVAALIAGKKFSELDPVIRKQIEKYTLNLIVLPKNIDLSLRLEIFRRINEAGVPLSAHDLRLALFGASDRVQLIRIAGVFDLTREGSRRMIENAIARWKVDYPWKQHQAWAGWWANTAQSVGQAPSQMFLHYCVARSPARIHMLQQDAAQQALGVRFDGTTTSMLDLWVAHCQRESQGGGPEILPDLATFKAWFDDFESWFNTMRMFKVPKISVNSATKVAMFIAAAAMVWGKVADVTDSQWEDVDIFLTQGPAKVKQVTGIDFPVGKGKWSDHKKQIEATFEIVRAIAKK